VFPIYATKSGLKLIRSNREEILEWESREIRVRGSYNECEEDRQILLSATKRMRTSP